MPYGLPQRWASAFREEGFDGIWYRPRHDPSAARSCVALFNRAGEADWPFPEPRAIDEAILSDLQRDYEVVVERLPRAAQLTPDPR